MMRLQKYLALCGVASRRHAEEMIAAGQVSVNGRTVTEMGTQVEETDVVRVNGKKVEPEKKQVYIMYHKPAGEMTTASGRQTDRPESFRPFRCTAVSGRQAGL